MFCFVRAFRLFFPSISAVFVVGGAKIIFAPGARYSRYATGVNQSQFWQEHYYLFLG